MILRGLKLLICRSDILHVLRVPGVARRIKRTMSVKVLDGGLGSELQYTGLVSIEDELWSARRLITGPDVIKAVHKSFLESGSDIIITATYQASIQGFIESVGLSREGALELFAVATRVAVEAVEEFWAENKDKDPGRQKPIVAGSLGPYGASQHDSSEYSGVYADTKTKEELKEWHRPHLEAMVKSGLDLIAMETIPCQVEAEALVELLKDFPETKAWLSYSVKDDKHIWYGETFADGVKAVVDSDQIIAVGCNCCNPNSVTALLESAKGFIGAKPFVVYPDKRKEFLDGRKLGEYKVPDLESMVPRWIELGACYVGGCCGSRPEDVQKIAEVVKKYNSSS
ncbi:homocysteine S-methyltransferase YbgG-like [Patiria miniata]|uniref:Hcy-binding domain-containing protein n=1 Tax=Patiria miniata TaxID=46514 RepID=A0A913ZHZ0_PATMI|nr:homocysteine S-methyltransferase YbgG-like [Patiria miniata]